MYEAADDPPNLKCFDQKRRYGVDFHFPVDRYVNALSPTRDDLQYACTFALPAPIASSPWCEQCVDASCDDPQCDLTVQIASAAYPATRILQLASRLSDRAVTTSVCRPQQGTLAARAIHQRILTLLPD